MVETQPESAASGGGGLGIDDTTLSEGVDPSSSAAAGDRLLGHLHSSSSTARPGDPHVLWRRSNDW